WRSIAASATPALSMTRQTTISATSGVGVGAAAASSAIFHVNCSCLGNWAELGCTRTSCTIIVCALASGCPRSYIRKLLILPSCEGGQDAAVSRTVVLRRPGDTTSALQTPPPRRFAPPLLDEEGKAFDFAL